MSLGIAFKGPEGIVLGADSRVTLTVMVPDGTKTLASFDNATKLLQVAGQGHVGVVTFGQGAIGTGQAQRTPHSYVPEIEHRLADRERLSVGDFAREISDFFLAQWQAAPMPANADPMVFFVAGYDEGDTYGRVFELKIPLAPDPVEKNPDTFGLLYGGQWEITGRLVSGYDPKLPEVAQTWIGE
jgi:hypothetical protein